MIDQPDARRLLEAMAATLTDKVMPELTGGAQHQARVVANLCRVVARDLADDSTATIEALAALLGHDGDLETLATELDRRLNEGELVDEAIPLLLADAARRAEVAKPGYTDGAR